MELNVDVSAAQLRHGWAYFSRPFKTETSVLDERSVSRGRQLFLHHCQKCHGEDGTGGGTLAKALKIKPANLVSSPKQLGRQYILVQINEGKGSMPQWKDLLTPRQVSDLTNYLKVLAKPR